MIMNSMEKIKGLLSGVGIPFLKEVIEGITSLVFPKSAMQTFAAAGTVLDSTAFIDITSGSSTFDVTIPQAENAEGKVYIAYHRTGTGTVTIVDDAETPNTIVDLSTTRGALLFSTGTAWRVQLLPYMSQDVTDIETYLNSHIKEGGVGSDGSSASTHADGSTYDFNANVTAMSAVIGGALRRVAAATNFDVAHGGTSPIGATNDTIIYAIAVYDNAGTATLFSVAGTAAPAVSAAAPSDSAITNAHAGAIRVCNFKVTRTGASTCTVAIDNEVSPAPNL